MIASPGGVVVELTLLISIVVLITRRQTRRSRTDDLEKQQRSGMGTVEKPTPKFQKPKIIVIDCPLSVMKKWKWSRSAVMDVFYTPRVAPVVPSHYSLAGTMTKLWTEASVISIQFENDQAVGIGDRVGFALADRYLEQEVKSIQMDKQQIQQAAPGALIGMKTGFLSLLAKASRSTR